MRDDVTHKIIMAAVASIALLLAPCALAQVRIGHEGWEGFSTRGADGKLDRCVLYNRSIDAINAEPYEMLGLSNDGTGRIGLLIFYRPGALTRGPQVPVTVKIDQRPPAKFTGDVISDFHIKVEGPLDQRTVEALRQTKTIEVTTQGQTQRFDVSGLAGVLDALASCADAHPP